MRIQQIEQREPRQLPSGDPELSDRAALRIILLSAALFFLPLRVQCPPLFVVSALLTNEAKKKVERPPHADRLGGEAKRIRAEAGKATSENSRDELAEIALEYERIAAKVERLEFEVKERKSALRRQKQEPSRPSSYPALKFVASGKKSDGE